MIENGLSEEWKNAIREVLNELHMPAYDSPSLEHCIIILQELMEPIPQYPQHPEGYESEFCKKLKNVWADFPKIQTIPPKNVYLCNSTTLESDKNETRTDNN